MSIVDQFRDAMACVGRKIVTSSDIEKGAYVPNAAQRDVMSAAGYKPVHHEEHRLFDVITVDNNEVLETTYYSSVRKGSGRPPEVRMGRGLVHWLRKGDDLLLGTDGRSVFALKGDIAADEESNDIETRDINDRRIAHTYIRLTDAQVVRCARAVGSSRSRRTVTPSSVYERHPAIREFARRRSGSCCEMPGCGWIGFEKDDGTLFIEIHHIEPLSKKGEDVIENVAGVCPNCHRRTHYACDRGEVREQLQRAIQEANHRFLTDARD